MNPDGGAKLDLIRSFETGVGHATSFALQEALWKHLDPRAVGQLAVATTPAQHAPGVDAEQTAPDEIEFERKQRLVDLIGDHLTTMKASYPRSFVVFGGPPGSHTTAWIAYTDQVRACMLNRTLANARADLITLSRRTRRTRSITPRSSSHPLSP